jgi:hypothetical protein
MVKSKKKTVKKARINLVIDCTHRPEVHDWLRSLVAKQPEDARKDFGFTPHRLALTALLIGFEALDKKTPVEVRELMSELAPILKNYWDEEAKKWL